MNIQIELTEDMINRAVQAALVTRQYDEEGEPFTAPIDPRDIVRERLREVVDKEFAAAVRDTVSEVTREEVKRRLDEGFPKHNSWGEREGTTTLAELVGRALFKKDAYSNDLTAQIRKEMSAEVKKAVARAVKASEATIVQAMKDAAADALALHIERTVGVRS